MKKSLWGLVLIFFSCPFAQAQHHRGLKFDNYDYKNAPEKATLIRGDYSPLPLSASIKQYAPKPLSQLQFNTSVGWATAYAARTILDAQNAGITDTDAITKKSFSPVFAYHLAKEEDGKGCDVDIEIQDALEVLKRDGVPRYVDFRQWCPDHVSEEIMNKAAENRITDYARLFNPEASAVEKMTAVKKAISEDVPVVIGMYAPKSFESAKEFWQPREKFSSSFKGQALCVVGYDDAKYGGAFEVMNSWGTEWGNDGFMWIRYETFAEFVPYAFELFHINGNNPDAVDMAGKITIQLNSGGQMNVQMTENPGYYRVSDSYSSGTLFQIAIESIESGFLYVFGSDLSKEIFPLFPSGNMSAALPYKESHVVLPAESQYIEIDDNPGTDFLCIVYSKEDLWLDDIKRQLEAVDGSFRDRVKTVFGDQLVETENVSYRPNSVEFFGKSKGKSIITVILEIGHI